MASILKKEYLIDTNILVYALDKNSPFFSKAAAILDDCLKGKIDGVVAHQNLTELVAILASVYQIPLSSSLKDAADFGANLKVIYPRSTTFLTFTRLLGSKRKADIFDYYLAATMIDSGVGKVLTRNVKDFKNIKGIKAINPF